jgi:proteasome accessory factor A
VSDQTCVPKLIGGDVELGNFIIGANEARVMSDFEASRLLLSEVEGLPRRRSWSYGYSLNGPSSRSSAGYDFGADYSFGSSTSRDFGRKYLCTNGGCIYIDLNHLELATPEVLSARDYQAVWAAMLRIARQAQITANTNLSPERRIVVLANNSDRQGHSYGGHQSFLMTRVAWDDMIRQRMIPNLFNLMAFQVSSIVFTGQGKVGSENGEPTVPFQISQRSDFIETLLGEQTTFNRPLVNTRDEPLCGAASRLDAAPLPGDRYARLHVIFYDTNLAPVATYLKVGVMQLILTMIEAGYVDDSLILDKPLVALHEWSRNPDLDVRMPLLSGQKITAVALQLKFLEKARAFEAHHGFGDVVADADQILALWEDTLLKLHSCSFGELRGRIDWVTKRALLEQALAENSNWDWHSPELICLDQMYSSIDPADSLFHSLDAAGVFEPVATEEEIVHFVSNAPENTRAWTRAMLLRAAGPDRVARVDWDRIDLKSSGDYRQPVNVQLPDPLGATRSDTEAVFAESGDFTSLLDQLHDAGFVVATDNQYSRESAVSLLDGYRDHQFIWHSKGDFNE